MALIEALDRLEGTRIRTNIVTGENEQIDGFGLIDTSSSGASTGSTVASSGARSSSLIGYSTQSAPRRC
jgi:hypothetical protein